MKALEKSLVSVIVPVYNIEPYISRCVESIIHQSYHNLEILLVDDGSTDRSGEICDQFAKQDSRIKVIHKRNGGLSNARNVALDIAKGELLTFVDGDDFLTKNSIESMCSAKEHTGAQIVCCLFEVTNSEDSKWSKMNSEYTEDKVRIYSRTAALEKMLRQSEFNNSACAKLYEQKLFQGVQYPTGAVYEDIGTTYKLFAKADVIALIRVIGYIYYQRDSSIQHSRFTQAKTVELKFVKDQKQFLDERFPELESATSDRLVSSCFHVLFGIYGLKNGKTDFEAEQNETEQMIRKYRTSLIKDKRTSKKTRMGCLLSYFGFHFTYFIYRLLGIRGKMIS